MLVFLFLGPITFLIVFLANSALRPPGPLPAAARRRPLRRPRPRPGASSQPAPAGPPASWPGQAAGQPLHGPPQLVWPVGPGMFVAKTSLTTHTALVYWSLASVRARTLACVQAGGALPHAHSHAFPHFFELHTLIFTSHRSPTVMYKCIFPPFFFLHMCVSL